MRKIFFSGASFRSENTGIQGKSSWSFSFPSFFFFWERKGRYHSRCCLRGHLVCERHVFTKDGHVYFQLQTLRNGNGLLIQSSVVTRQTTNENRENSRRQTKWHWFQSDRSVRDGQTLRTRSSFSQYFSSISRGIDSLKWEKAVIL